MTAGLFVIGDMYLIVASVATGVFCAWTWLYARREKQRGKS